MTIDRDLVMSSGSLDGPPLPALIAAALAGGFEALTLWPADYHPRGRHATSFGELRARLSDAGLRVVDVDAAIVWAGPGDPGPPYFEEAPLPQVLELATEVGASGVNAIVTGGPEATDASIVDAFGALCERAAALDLAVHLEFSGARPPRELRSAVRALEAAGHPNGGVMLDAWHVHHGPGSFADVADVPATRITGVQLCDAPAVRPEPYGHATRHQRLPPGTGAANLVGLLHALDAVGCAAPLTVEAFDTERVRAIGAEAFARELGAATRALLERAAAEASSP